MSNSKAAVIRGGLERLERELRDGQQQFFDRKEGGRQGVITQLTAIHQFIGSVFTPPLNRPLLALLAELSDLDFGTVGQIVKPKTYSGRAPDSTTRNNTKIYASLTVQGILELGFSLKEAVGEVAKVLIECGIRFPGRNVDPAKAIKQWRYELNRLLKHDPQSNDAVVYGAVLASDRELNKRMLQEIQRTSIKCRELTRKEYRDRLLVILAAAIMRDGDGTKPADVAGARHDAIRIRARSASR